MHPNVRHGYAAAVRGGRMLLARAWRMAALAVSFAAFGGGGLLLGLLAFPVLHLLDPDRARAQRHCRYAVHLSFRVFLAFACAIGLLRCEVRGRDRLRDLRGSLVVANHPSLIDVIVLVSQMPNARCVVKEGVWRSPFFGRVVRAAGYVPSLRADEVVERVAHLLRSGETVVLFPEGTRTTPGMPPTVRRGAALILLRSNRSAVPVHLRLSPRALAKGHSLPAFPNQRLRFVMAVEEAVDTAAFASASASERANAYAGTRLLEQMFREWTAGDTPGTGA